MTGKGKCHVFKKGKKEDSGNCSFTSTTGKNMAQNPYRSYCQSFEGQEADWEQLANIYDGQIMLDQLDYFL